MNRWLAAMTVTCLLAGLSGCGENAAVNRSAPAESYANVDSANSMPLSAEMPAEFNTESYDAVTSNPFLAARQNPLSTFSIDVDTASYSNVRRFLNQGQRPPAGAVRIEEMVNYFDYQYPPPSGDAPFSVNVEVAACPWNSAHKLARVGLKGREMPEQQRPASNLVFLLDVSGSMRDPNKLPLVQSAMKMLVEQLSEKDRIAIVVYAGATGLVLPSTSAEDKQRILSALDRLQAGGSTNGGDGIQLAYDVAVENYVLGGTNRVILCTDGDFNVGVTNQSDLVQLIERQAESGVFLSVLGFGTGNLKDSTMEKLADKGNGNYGYIDTRQEARKVLVEQISGTLVTIAKDVKVQVDFNPGRVQSYRLIGYENRLLRAEDFQDDTKDAGEIGAGHTVTALYEIVPPGAKTSGAETNFAGVDPSKYQEPGGLAAAASSNELCTVRIRYKKPQGQQSEEFNVAVTDAESSFAGASVEFRFAASVASFGMLLRNSEHAGSATFDDVLDHAMGALGEDRHGYRAEFLTMVRRAQGLMQAP